MLDHVSLGTHDLDRAVDFYTAVLAPFGYVLQRCDDNEAAFGTATDWVFFLYPLTPTDHAPGARIHVAFRAASRADVHSANAAALALGAETIREPAARPEFGADYFGAVLRDADGHVIEVMTRAA